MIAIAAVVGTLVLGLAIGGFIVRRSDPYRWVQVAVHADLYQVADANGITFYQLQRMNRRRMWSVYWVINTDAGASPRTCVSLRWRVK